MSLWFTSYSDNKNILINSVIPGGSNILWDSVSVAMTGSVEGPFRKEPGSAGGCCIETSAMGPHGREGRWCHGLA